VLGQHRFPAGEAWQRSEEKELGLHVVTLEGRLPSPQDVDGDYFRARSPHAQPARNLVSAHVDPESGSYEYEEVLRDPASPIAAERILSRGALKGEQAFADAFVAAFGEATEGKTTPPRTDDLKRLFRTLLAEPYARDVAALADRPLFGPRERRELDLVHERFDEAQKRLASRIAGLTTGVPEEGVDSATEAGIEYVGATLAQQLEDAGMPYPSASRAELKLRFRATLVMPTPIVRANTCVAGDTAVWEFESDDLFGRGFEMRALATTR
jgi:hypothetical protein